MPLTNFEIIQLKTLIREHVEAEINLSWAGAQSPELQRDLKDTSDAQKQVLNTYLESIKSSESHSN